MDVTYNVAFPFVPGDDSITPGDAVECLSANAARHARGDALALLSRSEGLARTPVDRCEYVSLNVL
jgi:hypothetical protein